MLWYLYPEQPKLTRDTTPKEQTSYAEAGDPGCEPKTVAALPKRGDRATKRYACAQSAQDRRQQADEIIQVRRSADAANASAITAYEQARVALWGLALGIVTIAAAVVAALYARASVMETRRIGEAQTRSYISVKELAFSIGGLGHPSAALLLVNSGQTPARRFRWVFAAKILASRPYVRWFSGDTLLSDETGFIDIAPGEFWTKHNLCYGDFMEEAVLDEIRHNTLPVVVQIFANMRWEDVFGREVKETHNFTGNVKPQDLWGDSPLVEVELSVIQRPE